MADDDVEGCMIAAEAFRESGTILDFVFVEDGEELIDYLMDHSRFGEKRLPDLILLDLNMPRKNGRDALVEIRSDKALQHIPIVILTASNEEDIASGTLEMANAFITKPETFGEWVETMKSLSDRWFKE